MIDTKFIKGILYGANLISATFEDTPRPRIEKVIIRPVEIKGKRQTQISYLDGKRDVTKNFFGKKAMQKIGEVLKMEFRTIVIKTKEEDIKIEIDDRGKVQMTKKRVPVRELELSHDRKKKHVLDSNTKYDFLVVIGIQNQDGTINAEQRRKFAQINEFLKVVEETIDVKSLPNTVSILDFGCGNAYITFAVYYYFEEILKQKAEVIGIDVQKNLIDRSNERAHFLGWDNLRFVESSIKDYAVEKRPDIVLCLHACDTASDDAIAQGINEGAKYIFAVPCCHNYIQSSLPKQKFPREFKSVASHGILLQRTCDIVTDTFRALLLRVKGYKTDVFEFVDSSHSAKNIMIRGVKLPHKTDEKTYRKEYEELKHFWGITPYLEKYIHY